MTGPVANAWRLAPLLGMLALLVAGCGGDTRVYGRVSYSYGHYDPWYRHDVIVRPPYRPDRPPSRPDRPAKPTHPIHRPPPTRPRPTPMPSRPMPRPAPARVR